VPGQVIGQLNSALHQVANADARLLRVESELVNGGDQVTNRLFHQLSAALRSVDRAETRLLRIENELVGSSSGSGSTSASGSVSVSGSSSGSTSGSGSGSGSGSSSASGSGSTSGSSVAATVVNVEQALAQAVTGLSQLSLQNPANDSVFQQDLSELSAIESQLTSLLT
jgi:hypothetical protein